MPSTKRYGDSHDVLQVNPRLDVVNRSTTFPLCVSLRLQTFRVYLETKVLPAMKEKREEFLLRELVKRWNHHKIMNKWMFKFFQYLVRCMNPCLPIPRPDLT